MCYHHLYLPWKILSLHEHVCPRLPPTACFVHGGRFQPWFFWRRAISCCQYVCCFSPASHGTISGESHFLRSSVYLCYVIWVGTTWWTAGCCMFPQNLSVSGSFPVAGWEHGALGLSHVVGWITWTGLFDVKATIHSADVWPSVVYVCWVKKSIISWLQLFWFGSSSDLTGFILTSNHRY